MTEVLESVERELHQGRKNLSLILGYFQALNTRYLVATLCRHGVNATGRVTGPESWPSHACAFLDRLVNDPTTAQLACLLWTDAISFIFAACILWYYVQRTMSTFSGLEA